MKHNTKTEPFVCLTCSDIRYRIQSTALGDVGIVWRRVQTAEKIVKIVLPTTGILGYIRKCFPYAKSASTKRIEEVCRQLRKSLSGSAIYFSLKDIDLSQFYQFQKRLVLTERKIPYGWVSTYGRLAVKIGAPGAARAVGTALARNPFPLIIPCHRTLKADGSLGGYQGGVKMKRALLELEGVQFQKPDRVIMDKVW